MTSQLSLMHPESLLNEARSGQTNHGEVFTRRWVVDFILDLVGYRVEEDLASKVIVEPSCGTGAFLLAIVDRLVASCRQHERSLDSAKGAIRAFDLLEENASLATKQVACRLGEHGVATETAERLAQEWVTMADFLLHDHELRTADFVVGNPPYIRLEDVPRQLT